MSTPFPILKLPFLCLKKVFLPSHVYDLINFSFVSKRCYQIVKLLNTPITGFNLHVDKETTRVRFMVDKNVCGCWYFNVYYGKSIPITRLIGGCEIKTIIIQDVFNLFTKQDLSLALKAGIEYLIDLFKRPILDVYFNPDDIIDSRKYFNIGFNQCEKMLIRGRNTIENQVLRDIIERITVTDVLNIVISVNHDFQCNPCNFKSKKLIVSHTDFQMTRHTLFNLKCAELILHSFMLTKNDFKQFITRWYHSSQTNLKMLTSKQNTLSCVLEVINFDDLNPQPWCRTRRSSAFPYCPGQALNCSEGLDILRHDGLLGTILIKRDQVFFVVWHNRFPDLTGLKIVDAQNFHHF